MAFDIEEKKPTEGDLICRNQFGLPGQDGNADYNDVIYGDPLHCDLVTDVKKNYVEAIGGNLDNSVKRFAVALNSDGKIADPNYFVLIKNKM